MWACHFIHLKVRNSSPLSSVVTTHMSFGPVEEARGSPGRPEPKPCTSALAVSLVPWSTEAAVRAMEAVI